MKERIAEIRKWEESRTKLDHFSEWNSESIVKLDEALSIAESQALQLEPLKEERKALREENQRLSRRIEELEKVGREMWQNINNGEFVHEETIEEYNRIIGEKT